MGFSLLTYHEKLLGSNMDEEYTCLLILLDKGVEFPRICLTLNPQRISIEISVLNC